MAYLSHAASGVQRFVQAAGTLARVGPVGLLARLTRRRRFQAAQRSLDTRYGVETVRDMSLDDLAATTDSLAFAHDYHPTPAMYFDAILRRIPVDFASYTFVDLGAGKALPLMMAARLGFQSLIGVEFGQTLHQIALENLARFRLREPAAPLLEILLGDAAEFSFPRGPLVVYLYNPFEAEIITRVLENLCASLASSPRDCWVVYVNPQYRAVMDNCPSLAIHAANADRAAGETYAIYRYVPPPSPQIPPPSDLVSTA